MEENNYCEIYKYIDQKPMFGNWEVDTMAYFLCGFYGTILFSGTLAYISITLGILIAWLSQKMKKAKYRNFIKHIFYMVGVYTPKSKRFPPSYQRYFIY